MMRIAIAGSGGLAQVLARHLTETANTVIILSRQPQPQLEAYDYQVAVIDYENQEDLRFTLRGIDLVISTVSGTPQINLIDAAAYVGVTRFVPAEFEGPPSRRSCPDPLDRDRAACLDCLRHYARRHRHPMAYTVFACGVFYERFARGGLASVGIGAGSNANYQGSYLIDVEWGTGEIVEFNKEGRNIYVCLTGMNDVARFLTAALEIDGGIEAWPEELRMLGERLSVQQIVQYAESVRGFAFQTQPIAANDLQAHLDYATYQQDCSKVVRMHELIATEQGRYDFRHPNLNQMLGNRVVPESFWEWLRSYWT